MSITDSLSKLLNADKTAHTDLLNSFSKEEQISLAYELKNVCQESWHNDHAKTSRAAATLEQLSEINSAIEIKALVYWTKGLVALSQNLLNEALEFFDKSKVDFNSINKEFEAILVQANRIVPLAILGHYDEAIEYGISLREKLKSFEPSITLADVEHNIGNLFLRRNQFVEAEKFFLFAQENYKLLKAKSKLAFLYNNLALLHSSQNNFRKAESLLKDALDLVGNEELPLQAVIAANLGEISLHQGKYNFALDYLEKARGNFSQLKDKQRSVLSLLEIADAYLELNLFPEAITRYEKLIGDFTALSMRAEQARVFAQKGRALMYLNQHQEAENSFEKAELLYEQEGNLVGAATSKLSLAQLHFKNDFYDKVQTLTKEVEPVFERAQTVRYLLMALWLNGESKRVMGKNAEAERIFTEILNKAEPSLPQIAQQCLISLGLIKEQTNKTGEAEKYFTDAINLIESLRAPLPGEEFRTAFFSDKLIPYEEMARLCLNDNTSDRRGEALIYFERARSRSLSDKIGSDFTGKPADEFETGLFQQVESVREELNWFYSQLDKASQHSEANQDKISSINREIKAREQQIQDLILRLQHRNNNSFTSKIDRLDISKLQTFLGDDTALIEYASLDGEWLAFVLTDEDLSVVRYLGSEIETQNAIEQFHFQLSTLKHGSESIRAHLPLLTKRIQTQLSSLYSTLIEPLEDLIGERRLAIVPHKILHYVPFHALFDGENYVIEKREVCYSPSAHILTHCLSMERRSLNNALLIGVADERAPRIQDEVIAIEPLFNNPISFLNEDATIEKLKEFSQNADLLHLACHGQFRQDNPTFSSLKLGNGWLTVHDASNLKLNCELVTLSACETGVNLIAPGDELIGLTRGFFAAGTPALVLSLWPVDDTATTAFMKSFYRHVKDGKRPIEALRLSQLEQMSETPHPFFWSPFVLIGRW